MFIDCREVRRRFFRPVCTLLVEVHDCANATLGPAHHTQERRQKLMKKIMNRLTNRAAAHAERTLHKTHVNMRNNPIEHPANTCTIANSACTLMSEQSDEHKSYEATCNEK